MLAESGLFFNMAERAAPAADAFPGGPGGGILSPGKGEAMLDTLEYTSVPGSRAEHEITVYALSTCGFCKRALAFLDARGLSYRYVYLDRISLETKTEAKKALKEKFKEDIAFPFAVIDGKSHLVGFIEPDWKKTLGLE
jgi:glutaredoxin-like protein NrdH